ncbi:MAG: hypothetical protein Q7S45_02175 [Candidatus Curtissbacteria bacterium]|nr:hypothetical protein [Candidatus Curtissbacteria bacterium]
MSYVKNFKPILVSHPRILTIKEHTSFGQTFKKIKNRKRFDFIWIQKPKPQQMAAVLLSRLSGKKFFWIQGFENPPVPKFVTRLLLQQSDRIIVSSTHNRYKLWKLGIGGPKIRMGKFKV